MALDNQQKRMAAAGRVFPSLLDAGQRPAVGNAYPVALFTSPAPPISFIIHKLDTLFKALFIDTEPAPTIYLDTDPTLPESH